ncbi:hypothetical protein D3C87_1074520 [compost metagenome]
MQGQLFIAEVVADHFRHEVSAATPQRQLNRALQKVLIIQTLLIVTVMFGQQRAVDPHMVLPGITLAQLFQIGRQQAIEAMVAPVFKDTFEPRAVDLFGRRHALQEIQRVGLVRKIAAPCSVLTLGEITCIVARHVGAMFFSP